MLDIFQLSYAIGFILGLVFFPALATAFVYAVCRVFGRKLVRAQVKSVYIVSFLLFGLLVLIGLFAG